MFFHHIFLKVENLQAMPLIRLGNRPGCKQGVLQFFIGQVGYFLRFLNGMPQIVIRRIMVTVFFANGLRLEYLPDFILPSPLLTKDTMTAISASLREG